MTEQIKEAADALKKDEICFLKSLCNPPKHVQDVLKCVFYLNPTGNEQMYIDVPPTVLTYGLVQSMLGTDHFLESLKGYKAEKMTLQMYYRIAEILRSHDTIPNEQDIKQVTPSAVGLFNWVIALMQYYGDNNDVYTVKQPPIPKSRDEIENEEARVTAETGIEAFEAHLIELEQEKQRKIAAEKAAAEEDLEEETGN